MEGDQQLSEFIRAAKDRKKRREKEPRAALSNKPLPQEGSETGPLPQTQSTSEDDVPTDDSSRVSVPERDRTRTLSPESGDQRKGHSRAQGPELQPVLDAFLDFAERYSQSMESKVIKQQINWFSSIVKEQLQEKIRCSEEIKTLKQKIAKVRSSGQAKTRKLSDAKYELMRAETQIFLLQQERAQLKLRLSDLRQGHCFLQDISQLSKQYLDYTRRNPEDSEKYGASSLAALLQEVGHLCSTEAQLRGINNQMEKLIEQ